MLVFPVAGISARQHFDRSSSTGLVGPQRVSWKNLHIINMPDQSTNIAVTDGFTNLHPGDEDDFNATLSSELGDDFLLYRKQWDVAATFETVPEYPLHIDFELNHSCNLKCPMCPYGIPELDEKNIGKRSWFSFNTFKKIVDGGVGRGLRSIGVNWLNEPLIRPDIADFVAYARARGIVDVFIHTNAMLLTKDMSERLIDAGLTRLVVSIDAITDKTYEKVRVGGDLQKVKDNVFKFLGLREKNDSQLPLLSTAFCKMSENMEELQQFEDFWRPHVNYLTIQNYIEMENRSGEGDSPFDKNKHPEFQCTHPFRRAVIRHDGTFLPCCNTAHAPYLPMGNIHETGIQEIWMSDGMRKLRELHRNGEYYKNPVCRACVKGCQGLTEDAS